MIEACTTKAIMDDRCFPALIDEYAAECANADLPHPAARLAVYPPLEAAGMLHPIRAMLEGQLIGFITVLVSVLPHYGLSIAVAESFFVAKAQRATLAGLKLLVAAENQATALGSNGLYVSAPFEGSLFRMLPRAGYRETNRVFFKKLAA